MNSLLIVSSGSSWLGSFYEFTVNESGAQNGSGTGSEINNIRADVSGHGSNNFFF